MKLELFQQLNINSNLLGRKAEKAEEPCQAFSWRSLASFSGSSAAFFWAEHTRYSYS